MSAEQDKKPRDVTRTIVVTVAAGDTLRLRGQRTGGSASIEVQPNGARLNVEK